MRYGGDDMHFQQGEARCGNSAGSWDELPRANHLMRCSDQNVWTVGPSSLLLPSRHAPSLALLSAMRDFR